MSAPTAREGLRLVRITLVRHRGVILACALVIGAVVLFLVYAHMSYARSIVSLLAGDPSLPAAERVRMLATPARIVSPDGLAAHILGVWCLTPIGGLVVVLAVAWACTSDVRHRTDSVRGSLRSRPGTTGVDLVCALGLAWAAVLFSAGVTTVLLHLTATWWTATTGTGPAFATVSGGVPLGLPLALVAAHTALLTVTTVLACRLTRRATAGAAGAAFLLLLPYMSPPGSAVGLLPWGIARSAAARLLETGYGTSVDAFLYDTRGVVGAPDWALWPPALALVALTTLTFLYDRRKTVIWR